MGKKKGKATCHPDREPIGRGLCKTCYHRWWREDKGQRSETSSEYEQRMEEFRASMGRSDYDHAITLRRHNLTGVEYWQMYDEQGGVCAICGLQETAKRGGKTQRLAVDHDHDTGRIRGLLCYRCNMMLGFGQDDKDRMMSAAIYLERSEYAG